MSEFIKISVSEHLLIPNQSNWVNASYTEHWVENVMPLYRLCLERCVVIHMYQAYQTIIADEFKTPMGNIIKFCPHWAEPEVNGQGAGWKSTYNLLFDNSL